MAEGPPTGKAKLNSIALSRVRRVFIFASFQFLRTSKTVQYIVESF